MGGSQSSSSHAPSTIDAKLKAKEWQWQLKTEVKHLDREVRKIQADELKLQKEIRAQAEKGNVQAVQMMAKSVVKSRAAVKRLEKTKASMHAVTLQLTTSIATMNTTASLRLSSDIMRQMNAIARVPEVSGMMQDMRKEMAKCADAEDSIEQALMEDGEEDEAAVEVQKVLEEMALEKMGPLAAAKAAAAPVAQAAPPVAAPPARQLVSAEGVAEPAPAPAPRPAAVVAPAPAAPSQPAVQPAPVEQNAPPPAAAPAAGGAGDEEDDDLMRRLALLKGS